MRLLLAINHAEIHRFIAQNYTFEISGIAESLDELYEILTYIKADTLIVSKYICSNNNKRQLIEHITALRNDLRVVYLYGERDEDTDDYLRFLESKGIVDYYVGTNINSGDLDRLLFGKNLSRGERILKSFTKRPKQTIWIKELDSAVITIYSNCSNGKSHLAWNLANELAESGYKTTLISLDRGNSANIYFGIPEIYYDLLNYIIEEERHKAIIDSCYKKGVLNIITGKLGSEIPIRHIDFLKLFYFARSKSNIVIIDTWTGLNEITLQAINNSNIDFLIFDSNLMHFHMNKLMIEQLGSDFIAEKTYAIINNCSPISESYKYIYKQINKLDLGFKGVMPLSSCGTLGCDLMHTGRTPYNTSSNFNISFKNDMDHILNALNIKRRKGRIEQIYE